ncbi:hypothetical protein L572_0545 [Bordetella bronchiseptica 345]|nr:hypothetical protein L572_0545 [Bordetella bronchiseptica 345]
MRNNGLSQIRGRRHPRHSVYLHAGSCVVVALTLTKPVM